MKRLCSDAGLHMLTFEIVREFTDTSVTSCCNSTLQVTYLGLKESSLVLHFSTQSPNVFCYVTNKEKIKISFYQFLWRFLEPGLLLPTASQDSVEASTGAVQRAQLSPFISNVIWRVFLHFLGKFT